MNIFDHREKKQIAEEVLDRMTGQDIVKERAAEAYRRAAINAAANAQALREYERQRRPDGRLAKPHEERPGLNRREE
jgi:hypothetical protein